MEKLIFLIGKHFNVIALPSALMKTSLMEEESPRSHSLKSKIMSYCRVINVFNLFVTNLVRVENSILGVV